MLAAKIFRPIRRHSSATARGTPHPAGGVGDSSPEGRVGKLPVTNTSPPGALLPVLPVLPSVNLPSAREEGWMALLEMVFEVTGWPDAD